MSTSDGSTADRLLIDRELLERAWRALANSATGREIGAYLDADPCAPECAETCARAAMCSTCSAVLSAPSPAGVDGWEVECAATYVSEFMRAVPSGLVPLLDGDQLCRLSDAQAIIDGLRGENERIRLNIAEYNEAISCYQSERDTLRQQLAEARDEITQHSNDLALAYMKGGADMRQQRDRLAQILRDLVPGCKWRIMRPRIDAALAEIDNGN